MIPQCNVLISIFSVWLIVLTGWEGNTAKANVRSFLVSREVMEESHFEFLRDNLEAWIPTMPNAPSAQGVHALLASKYKPTLDLGQSISARRGGEEYWPFEHTAFDPIKEFLRTL